jgi:hypothetical protein
MEAMALRMIYTRFLFDCIWHGIPLRGLRHILYIYPLERSKE